MLSGWSKKSRCEAREKSTSAGVQSAVRWSEAIERNKVDGLFSTARQREFEMATQAFVDSVVKEIIQPGVDQLMESRYFSELRQGKLSKRRLQGWAIQHYIHKLKFT